MNKDRGKNDPMHYLNRLRERISQQGKHPYEATGLFKRSQEKQLPMIPVTGRQGGVDKYRQNKGTFKP